MCVSVITGTNVTFMFHSFFNYLARSRYLSFFSLYLNFTLWSAGTIKSTILQILFFWGGWLFLGLVVWPKLSDPFDIKIPKEFVCDSPEQILGCAYTICSYGQISISSHNSQWITLPAQSCLVLYSYCANLLHSVMWLIVSSIYNLHLLFCYVLSILALI